MPSLHDLVVAMDTYYRAHRPHQRIGQAFFNSLFEQVPEIADAIRATPDDPFYDNSRVARFLNRVETELAARS